MVIVSSNAVIKQSCFLIILVFKFVVSIAAAKLNNFDGMEPSLLSKDAKTIV
jgi:hypothetical protein